MLTLNLFVTLLVKADIYINFDSVNASGGGVDATAYLASFGITLTNVTANGNPVPGSVYIENDTNFYGSGAVFASSPPNFLLQQAGGYSESYALLFSTPLASLSFTRCAIGGNVETPIWTATAYAGSTVVDTVGVCCIDSDTGQPAHTYTLTGPGITSLIVYGQPQNSAALGSAPLDDFHLTPMQPAVTSLYSFNGTNGSYPGSGLILGQDGNLYGTTLEGGAYNEGTVFKFTPGGALTTFYLFTNNPTGFGPNRLVQTSDGKFYGTASGGPYLSSYSFTEDIFYRLTTGGDFTLLHTFAYPSEGGAPFTLLPGIDGQFYGLSTTGGGGSNEYSVNQYSEVLACGDLLEISTNGNLTSLFSFDGTNGENGGNPIIYGNDGAIYGTTIEGGAGFVPFNYVSPGFGTIFKWNTNAELGTLVYFNGTNGCNPDRSGLVQANDGNFYGVTRSGGIGFNGSTMSGNGTVFRVTSGGALTSLYQFTGGNDGANPICTLTQASDGNLYGTTYAGGSNNLGTVFMITTNGTFTSLFSFDGANGAGPQGLQLVQAEDGNLYGTTENGGADNMGTIFCVVLSLAAPQITSQPVNITASPGGTAILSVGASGDPLNYQWALNGTNIVGATSATLTLMDLSGAEAGNYTVTISNILGSVTSRPATLGLLGLQMYAGLTVYAPVGSTNEIQYVNNLINTNWTTLTNLVLPASPYIYIDYSSAGQPQRFYRDVIQ